MSGSGDDPKTPKKGLPADNEDDWLRAIDEWGSSLGEIIEDAAAPAPDPAEATQAQAQAPKGQVFYKPDPLLGVSTDPDRTRVAAMTPEQRALLRSPTFPQELIPTKIHIPNLDFSADPTGETTSEAEPTTKTTAPPRPTTSPGRTAPHAPSRPAPATPLRPTTSPGRAAPSRPATPAPREPTALPAAPPGPRVSPPPPRAAPPRPLTSPTIPSKPGGPPTGRPRFLAEAPLTIPGTGPLASRKGKAGAARPAGAEPPEEPTLAARARSSFGEGAGVPHDTLESRPDDEPAISWGESTDEGDDFPAVDFGAPEDDRELQEMLGQHGAPSEDAFSADVPTAPSVSAGLEEIVVDGGASLGAEGQPGPSRHEHSFDAPPERPHEYWTGRAQLLESQLAQAPDNLSAARLLLETARIHELKLAAPQRAVSLYAQARAKAPQWLSPIQGLIRVAEDAGRWEDVDALLEEALGLELAEDERLELLLLRSELALSIRRDEELAARTLTEAARLAPDDPEVSFALAELAFGSGDFDQMTVRLAPLSSAPGRAAAGHALLEGASRERAGDAAGALAHHRAALEADPTAVGVLVALERTALATNDRPSATEARRRLAKALEDAPEASAVAYRAARLAHLADGRAAEAVQILTALPPTHARRAAALAAAESCGDVEAAQQAATALAAEAEGPLAAPPLLTLGLLLRKAGRLEEAVSVLGQAATAAPELGPAVWAEEEVLRASGHVQRTAERYAMFGQDAEAVAIFEHAGMSADAISLLERLPDDPAAHALLEVLEVDRGQWPRVCLRRAEQIARGGGAASMAARLESLAASQVGRLSDPAGAAETLRRVRELTPDDPITDTLPVLVTGDDAALRAAAAKLEASRVEDDERAADALVREGWTHETLGNLDEASRAFEQALARLPGHPFATAALGRLYWWRGEPAAAAGLHRARAGKIGALGVADLILAARAAWDVDSGAAVADLQAALAAQGQEPEEALRRLAAWIAPPGTVRADILEASLLAGSGTDAAAATAALVQAAEAREDAGGPERALELWKRAEALSSGDPAVSSALELGLERLGDTEALAARCRADIASPDPGRRASGYERLADVDGRLRGDGASAAASLALLAELRPDDLPTLRSLLRRQLAAKHDDAVAALYARIARAIEGHVDAAAHCRSAAHLADRAKDAAPFGSLELAVIATETGRDVWALRYLEANARLDREPQALAAVTSRLAEAVGASPERAAYQTREAEARLEAGDLDGALAAFEGASNARAGNVVALRGVAEAAQRLGKSDLAAVALDSVARASAVQAHVADAAYRAGVLWQDAVHDDRHALDSFGKVLDADATWQDALARLLKILDAAGRPADAGLACQRRIAAGGPPELLSALWRMVADRRLAARDRAGAKEALRMALETRATDADALGQLADLLHADADWKEAAERLAELGKVVSDAEEVRRVFFRLGELYDDKLGELQRAEESYRRVLTVDAQHRPTLERLARLLARRENWAPAREVCQELLQQLPGAAERRPWRVVLSQIQEAGFKDLRGAEAQLEEARREAPTDLEAVGLLADFYRRHNAGPALSVHLDRAAADLRRGLANEPFDAGSYRALTRILEWRGKTEGARAVAEVLVMLGQPSASELALAGGARGMQPGAADQALDEVIVPAALPPALQELLRLVHETLEKAVGAEPKTFGVGRSDRLPGKDHPLRESAVAVARSYGFGDVEIYVSQRDAGTLVALPGNPPSVIVGRDLFGATDDAERVFLVARCLKLVQAHLAIPLVLPSSDLGLWLGAIVKQFDPGYTSPTLDPGALEERTQRLAKILPRKLRDPLMPFALECEGAKALDPEAIAAGATDLADRSALLVCGSAAAAFGALRKMSGDYLRLSSPAELVARAGAVPSVRRLLAFAISEECFQARTRAAKAGG
jgi:tetratricopeptide (TPR) repeat protein